MKQNQIDADLSATVLHSTNPNYLGNMEVVHSLMSDFASTAINRVDPTDKTRAWAHADISDCVRLANIFLGKDKDFTPMPKWNQPGMIDQFLVRIMGLQGDAQQVMGGFFVQYLREIYGLYDIACSGAPPESWEPMVQDTVDAYTKLLLGIENPKVTARMLEE